MRAVLGQVVALDRRGQGLIQWPLEAKSRDEEMDIIMPGAQGPHSASECIRASGAAPRSSVEVRAYLKTAQEETGRPGS